MKKLIKSRKVQVKTETVRKLNDQQMTQTAGGAIATRPQNGQGYCFITH
jgi:hypothetical protein